MTRGLRLIAAIGLAVAAATPALAQANSEPLDLRPEYLRPPGDVQYEETLLPPVPPELTPRPVTDADKISQEIFGQKVDEAYGAFQRGYYLTALALAVPRAGNGDSAAQTLVAEIYAKGLGVPENPTEAARWYGLASENGDPLATFELAMMYHDGTGVPKDRRRSAELIEQAADAGNMSARYNLGLLHIEGIYAKPNMVEAARLIGEAAEAGIHEAEYDYAGMLSEGAGVAPDPAKAAEMLRRAATGGLIAAQVDYATTLYLGKDVPTDREGAVYWYRLAADNGNPVAQSRLAKLLAVGESVPMSLEDAAMWRALARRQGLNDPQLDKLLVSIQPDELSRAEERARYWPDTPPARVADSGTSAAPAPAATGN